MTTYPPHPSALQRVAAHEPARVGVTLTREDIEEWAGRPLTDEEVARLDDALPYSSVPEAVATIVGHLSPECVLTAENMATEDDCTTHEHRRWVVTAGDADGTSGQDRESYTTDDADVLDDLGEHDAAETLRDMGGTF